MKEERKKKQIYQILAGSIRQLLEKESFEFEGIQEIRLRVGKPLLVLYKNTEQILSRADGTPCLVTKEEVPGNDGLYQPLFALCI